MLLAESSRQFVCSCHHTTGAQHTSAWRAMFVSYSCARSPAACPLSTLASLATILCPTQAYLAALQDPGHLAGADLFSDISALPAASSGGTQPSAGASDSTHNRQQDPTASALVTELHDSSWALPSGQAASTDTATASGSLGLQTQPAQALEAAFAAAQGRHKLSVTMELQVNSPAVSALCHDCSHRCCAHTSCHTGSILASCPSALGTDHMVPTPLLFVPLIITGTQSCPLVSLSPRPDVSVGARFPSCQRGTFLPHMPPPSRPAPVLAGSPGGSQAGHPAAAPSTEAGRLWLLC